MAQPKREREREREREKIKQRDFTICAEPQQQLSRPPRDPKDNSNVHEDDDGDNNEERKGSKAGETPFGRVKANKTSQKDKRRFYLL